MNRIVFASGVRAPPNPKVCRSLRHLSVVLLLIRQAFHYCDRDPRLEAPNSVVIASDCITVHGSSLINDYDLRLRPIQYSILVG